MRDNEIIKALPFIAKYCKREYNDIRVDELLLGALDLINRQKAEIERLQAEVDKQYEIAEANVRAEIASGGTSCHWCEDKVRAEAYKKFAENVSKLICDNTYPDFDKDGKAVNIWHAKDGYKQIDNLLKEMVGDNDE